MLAQSGLGPELVLLAVDDLQVLIRAAVLLVAAGGQRGRVGLGLQVLLQVPLVAGLSGLVSDRGRTSSSWGVDVVPGSDHSRFGS